MTIYSIYAKANDTDAADAVFLPDSFSWGAFAFTWAWALWNRMWIVAVLALVVVLVAAVLPPVPQALLLLGLSIIMGLHGNGLLGWSLARRGLVEIGLIQGSSLEEAELRFYSGRMKAAVVPLPVSTPHDMLGLFGARS